jgi:large subunit ribosomal protein L25
VTQTLEARRRVGIGKGAGRRIRSSGLIPAVMYGNGLPSVNLAVDPRDVKKILATPKGANSVFSVTVNGGETVEMARLAEFQKHPLKRTMVHCDVLRLNPDVPLTFKVALNLVGVGPAQKMGARIRHVTREVRIECKPALCPASIDYDTSTLEPSTIIRLSDLKPADGIKVLYNDNAPVVESGPVIIVTKTEEPTDKKKKKK